MNLIFFSISVENAIGILTEIAQNLQISLGSIVTVITLSLPIHEHGMPFHPSVSEMFCIQHTSLLSPWLNLFLSILFFLILLDMEYFLYFLFGLFLASM